MGIGDAVKLSSSTRIIMGDALNSLELTIPVDWALRASAGTYISATSFSMTGDLTAYFVKGTKFKLTNSSTKYGHVISSSYGSGITTVVIAENTTYTLANTGVSNIYTSERCPVDFPAFFGISSSKLIGFSVLPSFGAVYWVHNKICTVTMRCSGYGTSNSTSFYLNVPFAANSGISEIVRPASYCYDNGVQKVNALASITASASLINLVTDHSATVWTASGNKTGAFGPLEYPI